METVFNEIPTDVDACYWCGCEIDHECIEAKPPRHGRRNPRYLHVECYNESTHDYIKWKLTKYVYVLNSDDNEYSD